MHRESDFIFGLRPVIEAIRAGKTIDRLLVKQGLRGELYHELMTEVNRNGISYQIVPAERLELITRKNHQGIVAWLSLIDYQSISNLLPLIYEKGEDPLIVVLDGVSDVRNFGAIARSAECLGAHAIVLPEKGSARITADAVKTSAGALHLLPVCRERSLSRVIRFLKDSGLRVACATERSENLVSDTDMRGPLALVMGSEDKGVGRELVALADLTVRIPMKGSIGSLNVSVAAGVLIYEIARQRNTVS
ncbi:MAG TPA: 23S rRNA (guanosine(2251)-2'-O)-methyltransferase RlmB [Bacteroidales bacterium]|nr:23S rRNA (guanosine(2251)-2'-O)-methyltransferase RlmB [Bacteroidales bacterium]HPJ60637.1 23S rRNA (guanosine(2251)-2'-O)-methyltransferase RlmB [Bacteroidales bacterium]HPR13554.1 23S rRNA (guanosine(2251)-2'-O)-methyltransferase RlmB [Bacteroidales bacterium]